MGSETGSWEETGAETLAPDAAAAPALLPGGPAMARWDRYELLELVGRGGMGAVYRARDRRLGRIVAIKLILGADPSLTMRLVREARAQARIEHPNVCRVFEVGEIDGRAYIALQFVDGEALHVAAARMTLDEKVAVIAEVATAVHEAHRLGIVHRDLKPANVMIERAPDGRWVPIVMDFGLARELTADAAITRPGAALGTPAYMSPEQARGDEDVDRRSDVYSLGATLYELLTGRPPFPGTALAQVLSQVIHDDPPGPRSLVPSLPVDLEVIALKCLAKDPAQRYPSARALADDLRRYLDGDPILGRRPPLWRRVRLRARRHRALVVLGGWSLAVIVALASLGLRACAISRSERAQAGERAALAEQLGRSAKEIELYLQLAYQAPLHDTRPERDAIRRRMRALAATRHQLGEPGDAAIDAAIHDALGRGHLALHEWGAAAEALARAADGGRDTPELHAARGRALGELYHRSLDDARRSGDRAWLARRQRDLEQQYLAPAATELARSGPPGASSALLDAQLALSRRDFAAAEQRALAVADAASLASARRLAALAAHAAALEAFDRGDYAAARPVLERAASRYADALDAARSDASLHEEAARTWLKLAELDSRQGNARREPHDRGLEAIDRALVADPDDAAAHTTKARILLRWYQTPALRGRGDQRPLFDRIEQAAARAVELDALSADAWDALGNAHIARGSYERMHGGEGAPWWKRAVDELGKALALRPDDPWANNDVGVAHRWLASGLEDTGGDPMPEYGAALRSYQRATAIDPAYVFAWSNQADIHTAIAEYDDASGRDPRPAVDRARAAGERCLAIDPNFYSVLDTLAQAHLALAHHLIDAAGDPTDALARARGYLDRAEAVHPGHRVTWYFRLVAAAAEAQLRLRDGIDPAPSIAAARQALNEVVQRADSATAQVEAARVALVEAAWAARAGRSTAALWARALADAERALALDPQSADARIVAADIHRHMAAAQRSRAEAELGISALEPLLARNPHLAKAQRLRTALVELRDSP